MKFMDVYDVCRCDTIQRYYVHSLRVLTGTFTTVTHQLACSSFPTPTPIFPLSLSFSHIHPRPTSALLEFGVLRGRAKSNTTTMKNTALSSLVVFALLELPRSVHSFTAATTRPQPPLAGGPAVRRSRTTLLHGLKLPDFLARTPEPAEAPPETTELALEATAADTSSAETIAAKEGEEGPTETQTLLQKVKQAGTAGGECPPPPVFDG